MVIVVPIMLLIVSGAFAQSLFYSSVFDSSMSSFFAKMHPTLFIKLTEKTEKATNNISQIINSINSNDSIPIHLIQPAPIIGTSLPTHTAKIIDSIPVAHIIPVPVVDVQTIDPVPLPSSAHPIQVVPEPHDPIEHPQIPINPIIPPTPDVNHSDENHPVPPNPHPIPNPQANAHAIVLHRILKNCSDESAVTIHGVTEQIFPVGQEINYYNFSGNSRKQEQCYNDGTFDTYYDESLELNRNLPIIITFYQNDSFIEFENIPEIQQFENFSLPTNNLETILNEIHSRTNLSNDFIKSHYLTKIRNH